MIKTKLLGLFLALAVTSSVSEAALVKYVIHGDLFPDSGLGADTFSIKVTYKPDGKVKKFALYLDGAISPAWKAVPSKTELRVYDDVSSSCPESSNNGSLSYTACDIAIFGDVFSVEGTEAKKTSLDIGGLGFSLTDQSASVFNGTAVPVTLSLSDFNGGLIPVGGDINSAYSYGNYLYSLSGGNQQNLGSFNSVCSGSLKDCPSVSAVPIPAALWLFLSGIIVLLLKGRKR